MYNTARSGTVQGNQGGPAKVGSQPNRGRNSLGDKARDLTEVRTGQAHPDGDGARQDEGNYRQRGGQYRIGLFGCFGHARRVSIDAETPGQDKSPAESKAQSSPIRLTPSRDCMAVFATVATHESRELADVLTEALTEQAERWAHSRHALHIDPRDAALLDAYLDSLEADPDRLDRLEETAAYRHTTTPAMLDAARGSDERESYRTEGDDHADFLARCGAEDGIGITLAMQD